MRTAHSLPYSGGFPDRDPTGQRAPWTETPQAETPWTETPPVDCRAIKQGMVKVNTWVFILRRYKWHIHAGSWSLVNCWREGSTLPYKGCSWILMNAAVGHMNGSALMVIGVSAWYPNIPLSPWKKRLCLHAKKLLLEIYHGP